MKRKEVSPLRSLDKIRRQCAEILQKAAQENKERKLTQSVTGTCRVCKGLVVEKTKTEFDARFGPVVIGPASKNQYHTVRVGFYCTKCGIKYEFPSQVKITKAG